MRDELTCWDALRHRGFTGQEAALAIVGEPQTDDPATLRKAMPVLDLMRCAYDGTRRWFADAPEDDDTAPKGLLVSVEMQAAKARIVQMNDVVAEHPYCEWPRTSEHVSLLFAGDLQRSEGQESNLPDAIAKEWRFLTWLRTPMADFDRQTFSRAVLARWVQEVDASSLYPFTDDGVKAATADVQTPQSAEQDAEYAPCVASWSVVRPERYPGYRKPLYDLLSRYNLEGRNCPTPRDVLDTWRENKPHDVLEVMPNSLKYYDGNGNVHEATLKAIKQAINGLVKKTTTDE